MIIIRTDSTVQNVPYTGDDNAIRKSRERGRTMTSREMELDDEITAALGKLHFAVKELATGNRTMARLYPYARQALGILEEVAIELGNERKIGSEAKVTRKGGAE